MQLGTGERDLENLKDTLEHWKTNFLCQLKLMVSKILHLRKALHSHSFCKQFVSNFVSNVKRQNINHVQLGMGERNFENLKDTHRYWKANFLCQLKLMIFKILHLRKALHSHSFGK